MLICVSIQVRKIVPSSDSAQTSPDSTSQEPDPIETGGGGEAQSEVRPVSVSQADSVSQSTADQSTGINGVKRTAEAVSGSVCDNKRIKSDSES